MNESRFDCICENRFCMGLEQNDCVWAQAIQLKIVSRFGMPIQILNIYCASLKQYKVFFFQLNVHGITCGFSTR